MSGLETQLGAELEVLNSRNLSFNIGVVSNIGGITKFRTMADMKDTVMDTRDAFDKAITNTKKRSQTVGSKLEYFL